MRRATMVFGITLLLVLAGCSRKVVEETAPSVSGESGKPGSHLAYEHRIDALLPAEVIPARMEEVRTACSKAQFGGCSLLRFEQSDGEYPRGMVTLRVAPDAVEPLAALATKEGRMGSRETSAEDLAEAVEDSALQRERLELQRNSLLEFRARRDLSVSDLISISRELAAVESALQSQERTAAEQQRRIETNLLSIHFATDRRPSRWSRIGDAFDGLLDSVIDGSAESIEMLAFGLPFLLLAFPLALLWRWLWRRLSNGGTAPR